MEGIGWRDGRITVSLERGGVPLWPKPRRRMRRSRDRTMIGIFSKSLTSIALSVAGHDHGTPWSGRGCGSGTQNVCGTFLDCASLVW
jgi:hypothetical protein